MMDVLMASPTEPLPEKKRTYQLTLMFNSLDILERGESPSPTNWDHVNDAVMLMKALKEMNVVEDAEGLLDDAIDALGRAGDRHMKGKSLRLDATGIQAVRAVLEDYSSVLEVLPARTMITAHRKAEQNIKKILGRK